MLIELQEDGRFKHQLWLLPFPSGEPQLMPDHDRLGPGRDFPTRRLSWEPDDRHVVVANEEAGRGMHLFRADIKTGSLEPITTGTDSENAPAVSPDGSQIAYMSGAIDFDLIEASPNDGRTRVLLGTPRSELFPIWLTDSRYAYITAMRGTPEIWARDGADWPAPILTAGNDQSKWLGLERLAVSKDRRRIAYGAVFRDRHAIWIVPIAGGQPVPLDDPSIDQHGAAWSPDGNWIAYQRLSGTHWNIVTRPVGPGSPEVLADAAPGGGSTAWSPLGDWIAFARADGLQGVSPNGKKQVLFSPQRVSAFDFTADGHHIYAARRGSDRAWELATIDVATQTETVTRLDVPTNASVVSLNADATGRRLVLAVGTPKFDVWLLEGYGTARK